MVNVLLYSIVELCRKFPNFTVVIFASNANKCRNVFDLLEICLGIQYCGDLLDIRRRKDECSIRFNNGSIISVTSLSEGVRGRRANAILYDKSTPDELVDCIVYPMACRYYSDKNETIVCNGTILRVDFDEYNK